MSKYANKPVDPHNGRHRRLHAHKHNRMFGTVCMMKQYLKCIQRSETLTPLGEALSREVQLALDNLGKEVWAHRRELDGTIAEVGHKWPKTRFDMVTERLIKGESIDDLK